MLAVSALDVAFVGSLAGLAGAIGAPLSAWFIAKGNREHERTLGRDERAYESRSTVYVETLTVLMREMRELEGLVIWSHHPEGPNPGVPERLSPDELGAIYARVSSFGTDAVLEAVKDFQEAGFDAWRPQARKFQELRERGANPLVQAVVLAEMDKIIANAKGRLREVESLIRAELSSL